MQADTEMHTNTDADKMQLYPPHVQHVHKENTMRRKLRARHQDADSAAPDRKACKDVDKETARDAQCTDTRRYIQIHADARSHTNALIVPCYTGTPKGVQAGWTAAERARE